MNENKEFDMMDAFMALKELDDDSVATMIRPKKAATSGRGRSLHEGKSYPISGARSAMEEAKNFLNENDEVQLEVIDPDADALEHVKDRIDYVGQMILRCNRCHANKFIDMDKLVEDPDSEGVYNKDDECPNCKTSDTGYEIIGQVGKYEEEKPEAEATEAEGTDEETEAKADNDEVDADELKFDNDEAGSEEDESSDEEAETEQGSDEVTEISDEEESEADMMETSSSEDEDGEDDSASLGDEVDVDDELEVDDEDEEDDVKESLNEDSAESIIKEANMYNEIIDYMANGDAQDEWERIWNAEKSKIATYNSRQINDLQEKFEEIYEKYHKDGLMAANDKILTMAHRMDKQLGLSQIENHHMYVEAVEVAANHTISEVLNTVMDADKIGRIVINNKQDNAADETIYDGTYNNLPLNLANATCTGFDVNNRTLACNIDQDENHGRRCLSDILGKFGDGKSDNIHLYDIASSDEVFKGNRKDAIAKYGNCGFISIDTPAVIRLTICDPSLVKRCADGPCPADKKTAEESLVENIIRENDLSITRVSKVNSNEYWIKESIAEREDLDLIFEAYVRPCSNALVREFAQVTGYKTAYDEAFEAGYAAATRESLNEGYTVKYGYGSKKTEFDDLQAAIDHINDGMKNRESDSFVLYNDGKEMIWLDYFRDRDFNGYGYSIARQDDKSVEFDKATGLKIKVVIEDNPNEREMIVKEAGRMGYINQAPKLARFRYVLQSDKPSYIDFEEKVIYYNKQEQLSKTVDSLVDQIKTGKSAIDEIFGFKKKPKDLKRYIVGVPVQEANKGLNHDRLNYRIIEVLRNMSDVPVMDVESYRGKYFTFRPSCQISFVCPASKFDEVKRRLPGSVDPLTVKDWGCDAMRFYEFAEIFRYGTLGNYNESLTASEEEVDENLGRVFRKIFDKPASTDTQQSWEDELNGEMGEISSRRRAELEKNFAQQRDWEARHESETASVEEPELAGAMTEAFMSREQLISELKSLGKNYFFDKYTDAQLFRMLEKARARKATIATPAAPDVDLDATIDTLVKDEEEAIDGYDKARAEIKASNRADKDKIISELDHIRSEEVEHIAELRAMADQIDVSVLTCESCGGQLNDGGTCPVCDDGEEDLGEALNESATWTCVFDGDEIGTVVADSYEEAIEEMQHTYPELDYTLYDGCFDVFPANEEIVEDGSDIEDYDWADEDDVALDEPKYIDPEVMAQMVVDEMPRAIKECGKSVKALMAYFASILPEVDLGAVDHTQLKAVINDYLANDGEVVEEFTSYKSRKELGEAITECRNNSTPYTVRRSIKEGYRYDLIINEADDSDETISDDEIADHEKKIKSYSKDNKEEISKADGEEVIDKLSDASSYTEFVKILNKDRKSKAFLQYLRQHYNPNDDEIETVKSSGASNALVVCSELTPTQQNISLDKSLGMIKSGKSDWAVKIINNPATAFDDPTIIYAGKYIIDGHHRWSKAYALVGPTAKIKVINFPEISGVTWKDMLKATQLAIVAKKPEGDLIHKVDNDNMLADASGQAAADYYIENADDKVVDAMKDKGFGDDKEAQSEHVKKNVAAMADGGVVSGAAPRAVMPQTDTAPGSVELLKKAVIDLTEGDNLPVPADEAPVALTAAEKEFSANVMRISKDIANAISDVYGIDANPELIVADILQDLRLIRGDITPADLEDTPINRLTAEMYASHEAFYEFMDQFVSALTGQELRSTPETKFKRAVEMLSGPNFSTESIRRGIEATQFQRLVANGQVPFIPSTATPLLGEEVEDGVEVPTEKFDADMNEYFNEAYDETVLYTTTGGSVNADGTILLEGVIQTEDASSDIKFTLKPETALTESLENESDRAAKLESMTYSVSNNLSEEVFKFKFSE